MNRSVRAALLLLGAGLAALPAGVALADPADVPVEPRSQPPYPDWMSTLIGTLRQRDPPAILMGDSLVAGWPKDLAGTLFDAEPVNFGAGGDTTANLLWRVRTAFGRGMALRSALLLVGTNDLPKRAPEAIAGTIGDILSTIRADAPRACVTVVALLPRRDGGTAYATKIRAINDRLRSMASPRVRVIDASAPLRERCPATGPCDLYKDSVHLTRTGYELVTDAVRRAQQQAPCS
ncbi:GDSL-type esterase/lipase family protein [Azospirillum rugosum]|uniref:Platelet-activating factor acetylhydrolase IB subunit beta/gamma n=1 Tax=Azospirillum rugosum TaxID=416170 RepID=A0ABS4SFZ5_9PROT|nr:GDSL-type esterase/lipase family protein [Azospirillum rugosum]MBP2291489.1 platelet-activating factor acetylhydrolase IB subunit beta/gamma [Azospirillum rugosum]MDQ0525277.1 platelet-activating factor acetylhydrolase IB subunit beta/gamma [Azospirillum rugosum]